MGSKRQDAIGVSVSIRPPTNLGSRSSSVSSGSPRPHVKRDAMSQVLDQIHSSASKTSTLTTFNDFSTPPPLSSPTEDKNLAGQLVQGGVGGLYGRLKATVGGARDSPSDPITPKDPEVLSLRSKVASASETNSMKSPLLTPVYSHHQLRSLDGNSTELSPQKHDPLKQTISIAHGSTSPSQDHMVPHASSPTVPSIIIEERNSVSTLKLRDEDSAKPTTNFPEASEFRQKSHVAAPYVASGDIDSQDQKPVPSPRLQLSPRINPTRSQDRETQPVAPPPASTETVAFPSLFDDKPVDSARGHQVSATRGRLFTADNGQVETEGVLPVAMRSEKQRLNRPRPEPLKPSSMLGGKAPYGSSYRRADSPPDSSSSSRPVTGSGQVNIPETPAEFIMSPVKDSRHVKKQLISKDFWMKDENAKVCFLCGDGFSTFRRKHHCRMCGQIYDAKCTSLISGRIFGQPGTVRVCKTCQTIVTAENDSSDDSGEENFLSASIVKQSRFTGGGADLETASGMMTPVIRSSSGFGQDTDVPESPRPPTAKRRTMTMFAPDHPTGLSRPSSSRSLKSLVGRPRTASHKHQSSHLHQHTSHFHHLRSLRAGQDDGAPFRRSTYSDQTHPSLLPAFHTDSIIDPDLAAFLSDEGSSEEESTSLNANLQGDGLDHGSAGLGNLFEGLRRTRSHANSKSGFPPGPASRDADAMSISSSHVGHLRRPRKSRALSSNSVAPYGPSPRIKRSDNVFTHGLVWPTSWRRSIPNDEPVDIDNDLSAVENDITHDSVPNPSGELSAASLEHVKHLLRQSLYDANIDHVSRWEKILMPILLRTAENLDPSLQRNDSIDIRQYIKLKKAPGGRPSDTTYVTGVAFTGNVALKRMPRSINNARLLLVSFPIMYARQQQHFMSLEPIIAQEREYLRKLVNRILALQPDVLFVQQSISGLALEFLQDADVAVVCNVKESVMHAISRCSRTRIISSVDKLAMNPSFLGYCSNFEIKTLMSLGYKKSYVFISGCQRDLGCTIVLRGADIQTLRSLKATTEFMCFVAYNLKLETSLLRDQFVALPLSEGHSYPRHRQSSLLELARMPARISRIILDANTDNDVENPKSLIQDSNKVNADSAEKSLTLSEPPASESISPQTRKREDGCKDLHSYADLLGELKNRILSVSPSVRFEEPYLLKRGHTQESQLLHLRKLQHRDNLDNSASQEKIEQAQFELVRPEMVYDTAQSGSKQVREVIRAIHDAEFERTLHRYNTLRRRWEIYLSNTNEPFSPFSHQRIVVLFSVVSRPSLNTCAGPDLLAMEFYQEHHYDSRLEPDVPLGEYVESLCLQAETPCITDRCDQLMLNHCRQYVHGEGQIKISIERQPPKLKGLQDTILMWSRCKICEQETQVTPMSSNTWKYSFGKYLELSFWSRPLYPRAGSCQHDINRDHDRYFGFKELVIHVHYEPINLMEVIVPRATITWKVDKDLQLKNAQYNKIEDRLVRFMSSVKERLSSINVENVTSEKEEACRAEVDTLLKKADSDLELLRGKLQDKYMNSKFYENVPLNRVVRAMQEKVVEWDAAFNDFERNFLPSDKDLRAMVTQQLKKMYLNREESTTTVNSTDSQSLSEKFESLGTENAASTDFSDLKDDLSQLTRNSGPDSTTSDTQDQSLNSLDPGSSTELKTSTHSGIEMSFTSHPTDVVHQLDLATPTNMIGTGDLRDPTTISQTGLTEVSGRVSGENGEHKAIDGERLPQTVNGQDLISTIRKLPFPAGGGNKSGLRPKSPTLIRSKTQTDGITRPETKKSLQSSLGLKMTPIVPPISPASSEFILSTEKDFLSKIGANPLKRSKPQKPSMIPRAVSGKKGESKVSSLAMHFERLSREFEKERLRERRHKFTRNRLRAFPTASSKPVVEIYRNAHEAIGEREASDDGSDDQEAPSTLDKDGFDETVAESDGHETESFIAHGEDENAREAADLPRPGESFTEASYPGSEADGTMSETEMPYSTDGEERPMLTPMDASIDLELPKHERGTLMKMLTSFWSERSSSGWAPLEYPMVPTDHVFADSDVIVREDEPSSLIAFSLASQDYKAKMQKFRDRIRGPDVNETGQVSFARSTDTEDPEVEDILLGETATHLRYQFQDGPATMHCKVFYSESFDAIRRKCGVAERFVESLSRCLKWDSKGGKTKSLFLKTLDERFVLKSLSQVEVQAFLKFAPDYFHYMSETLFHSLPSAIAKILGFYQVVIRNPSTGLAFTHFLQVMENVFYEGPSNRMFDLKGSMRNRKIESTGEENEVLLDENLLDYVSQSPIYVRNHSNAVLAQSVQNDTLFCSKQNVMDYSLVVGLYEDRKELVVGVIDYIRTYTWDKKLESMLKDRGKHKATVREPRKYRARFRESIARYFPLAPSCWHVLPSQKFDTMAMVRAREYPKAVIAPVDADDEAVPEHRIEHGTVESAVADEDD